MVLSDLAEVAVPGSARNRWQLADGVSCVECGNQTVKVAIDDIVVCTECHARICVLCGCTDAYACEDGCRWMLPGVCSTHEGDERLVRIVVPRDVCLLTSTVN